MVRIIVADDDEVVRTSLGMLLEREQDFQVIERATDGLEAVSYAEHLKPDILVADMLMPGLNGIEVSRRISGQAGQTRVVILSMYEDEAYVFEALRAGAKAYVLKRSDSDELIHAIREVVAGRNYIDMPLSGRIIEGYLRKEKAASGGLHEMLTAMEQRVLQLAVGGVSGTEIARLLSTSRGAVERTRVNIVCKLGICTQGDLVGYLLGLDLPLSEE